MEEGKQGSKQASKEVTEVSLGSMKPIGIVGTGVSWGPVARSESARGSGVGGGTGALGVMSIFVGVTSAAVALN